MLPSTKPRSEGWGGGTYCRDGAWIHLCEDLHLTSRRRAIKGKGEERNKKAWNGIAKEKKTEEKKFFTPIFVFTLKKQ